MRHRFVVSLAVLTLALAACSSGSSRASPAAKSSTPTLPTSATGSADPPTPGPAAAVTNEITGGKGLYLASATTGPSVPKGWVESDYAVEGTAPRTHRPAHFRPTVGGYSPRV